MMKTYYQSPVGLLEIEADNEAIVRLSVTEKEDAPSEGLSAVLQQCIDELDAFFSGKRTRFDVPIRPEGTAFQQTVWKQLQAIPYGETISYAELASRCGNPRACRAVGSANGKNPIAIIIPCHRVIASNGTLGGYAYGLPVKEKLLKLEKGE